ncbi:Uncharacterized conserved protein, DUF1015 family [Nocardioides alpinus]|uniref:DUF1015 domain-containing protein n=1 Tax=Nocardioides alpinus TaxID=748909 RepID=A0A1I1BEV2_9ACTN|nr:DUF1015 family protein [Nocardioides alpinus]PKH39876.1 DUF1015 domain-containing protein [Nocardioides alpinus]SFB48915.1 Uncharacterized conserved protein, DUF1015 family [Nocardioides alpinus]
MDPATDVPPYVARPLTLLPFRAVMLAPNRVGDPASARALARPYRDVAARLTSWIDQGRATADTSPAVYLHEYTSGGLTVRGLVGALGMSARATTLSERAVWPHEAIHPEQAGELADRMFQMDLNPAPILLVHHGDPGLRALIAGVSRTRPDWRYLDRTGQRQRIWAIRSADVLSRIEALLAGARCLLADGHHRYAAYLRLQQEHPGTAWDAGLAMLVDQDDTPLFLGAIHRTLPGTTLTELVVAARTAGAEVSLRERHHALGALDSTHLVLTDGHAWHTVTPHGLDRVAAVSWLHDEVLSRLPHRAERVEHHHNVDDALAATSAASPAVLLPSPDFDQVRALVESGGLLPEKATSFQPKPSLGVLMRPMTDA